MKIAVVGSGVSGLVAGVELQQSGHEVTLFEASETIGGHAKTIYVPIDGEDEPFAAELGVFMLDPQCIHPVLGECAKKLGAPIQEFAFATTLDHRNEGISWTTNHPHEGFRRDISTAYSLLEHSVSRGTVRRDLSYLSDLRSFCKALPSLVTDPQFREMSVSEYQRNGQCSKALVEHWLAPQMFCWWGIPKEHVGACSIQVIADSMEKVSRMQQYIFTDGWGKFLEKLALPIRDLIRTGSPVTSISRQNGGVRLAVNGKTTDFDNVVLAVRPHEALALLTDANAKEREVLSGFETVTTRVYLHTDTRWLPVDQKWSVVNLLEDERGASSTFWCGSLHPKKPNLFVTWMDGFEEIPDNVIATADWARTLPTTDYVNRCRSIHELQGGNSVWHCGAHVDALDPNTVPSLWHDNALRSGSLVAKRLNEGNN
jgi:predicted NAD/FAD-binding protein